jgi:hypothetical protein
MDEIEISLGIEPIPITIPDTLDTVPSEPRP